MTTATHKLGDRAFEVEWVTDVPVDENGDSMHDQAVVHCQIIDSHYASIQLAKEVYPQDFYGSVQITPVELTDPYGENIRATFLWEPCGDTEYYDGEE